jgi:hypothetical protein
MRKDGWKRKVVEAGVAKNRIALSSFSKVNYVSMSAP